LRIWNFQKSAEVWPGLSGKLSKTDRGEFGISKKSKIGIGGIWI
jgi:hypothetical protein